MLTIPSEPDWQNEPRDLDVHTAYEHFHGKNLDEAFNLFVDNALLYQEDIVFMPVPCFRYYIHAYMNYLLSNESRGDYNAASCFFIVVESRKEDICSSGDQLKARVCEVLSHIGARQKWYDADICFYDNFAKKSKRYAKKSKRLLDLLND